MLQIGSVCVAVSLWLYGSVALRLCGSEHCGFVALWLCGSVVLWLYVYVYDFDPLPFYPPISTTVLLTVYNAFGSGPQPRISSCAALLQPQVPLRRSRGSVQNIMPRAPRHLKLTFNSQIDRHLVVFINFQDVNKKETLIRRLRNLKVSKYGESIKTAESSIQKQVR